MSQSLISRIVWGQFEKRNKQPITENFEDEKEVSRSVVFQRRVKKTSILHRLVLVFMGICSVALTVQTFIIHHEVPESSLMMLIGYLSIAFTIGMITVNVIDVCIYSMGSPPPNYHFIVSSILFIVVFGFAVTTAVEIPAMVYRHANEQFMDLFFMHKIHIQGLLVGTLATVVLLCFVGFISLLMYWCEGRYSYVRVSGAK